MLQALSSPQISIGEYSTCKQQAKNTIASNSHFTKFSSAMMSNTTESGQQDDILANIIKKLNSQSTNLSDLNSSQKPKLQKTTKNDATSINKKIENGIASNHLMPDNQSKVF